MLDNDKDIFPQGSSKVERISKQTKGLVEDVRTWVDLKMQFTQLDLEDRVDKKVNEAAKGAMVGAVALIAGVFVLLTAALGFGQVFDSTFLGFLAVTGFIVLVLVVVMLMNPRIVKVQFFDRTSSSETKQLKP